MHTPTIVTVRMDCRRLSRSPGTFGMPLQRPCMRVCACVRVYVCMCVRAHASVYARTLITTTADARRRCLQELMKNIKPPKDKWTFKVCVIWGAAKGGDAEGGCLALLLCLG